MTVPIALALVAILLALVHEFQANGKDLLGWAVVILALASLWGPLLKIGG